MSLHNRFCWLGCWMAKGCKRSGSTLQKTWQIQNASRDCSQWVFTLHIQQHFVFHISCIACHYYKILYFIYYVHVWYLLSHTTIGNVSVKATNKVAKNVFDASQEVKSNLPKAPSIRSLQGDWRFWIGILVIVSFGLSLLSATSVQPTNESFYIWDSTIEEVDIM